MDAMNADGGRSDDDLLVAIAAKLERDISLRTPIQTGDQRDPATDEDASTRREVSSTPGSIDSRRRPERR